ncbi:hypothetical protein PCE1_002339 [Barthelona sp. PCE]
MSLKSKLSRKASDFRRPVYDFGHNVTPEYELEFKTIISEVIEPHHWETGVLGDVNKSKFEKCTKKLDSTLNKLEKASRAVVDLQARIENVLSTDLREGLISTVGLLMSTVADLRNPIMNLHELAQLALVPQTSIQEQINKLLLDVNRSLTDSSFLNARTRKLASTLKNNSLLIKDLKQERGMYNWVKLMKSYVRKQEVEKLKLKLEVSIEQNRGLKIKLRENDLDGGNTERTAHKEDLEVDKTVKKNEFDASRNYYMPPKTPNSPRPRTPRTPIPVLPRTPLDGRPRSSPISDYFTARPNSKGRVFPKTPNNSVVRDVSTQTKPLMKKEKSSKKFKRKKKKPSQIAQRLSEMKHNLLEEVNSTVTRGVKKPSSGRPSSVPYLRKPKGDPLDNWSRLVKGMRRHNMFNIILDYIHKRNTRELDVVMPSTASSFQTDAKRPFKKFVPKTYGERETMSPTAMNFFSHQGKDSNRKDSAALPSTPSVAGKKVKKSKDKQRIKRQKSMDDDIKVMWATK